uniref:Uncharacterized protein n=1 Tax=Rhizophora mucronata TaxID=61149 RepID=A0A2P2P030_RHIMU
MIFPLGDFGLIYYYRVSCAVKVHESVACFVFQLKIM